MNWTQPLCEACWIDRESTWEGARLLSMRKPVRLIETEIEQCCICGGPTIVGIFIRIDPRTVNYPTPDSEDESSSD